MAIPNLTVKRWRQRKSECFWQHACMEHYTANKVAAFLRAGQKEGRYWVRVVACRRSFRLQRRPEYYWMVRAYRKLANSFAVDIDVETE